MTIGDGPIHIIVLRTLCGCERVIAMQHQPPTILKIPYTLDVELSFLAGENVTQKFEDVVDVRVRYFREERVVRLLDADGAIWFYREMMEKRSVKP